LNRRSADGRFPRRPRLGRGIRAHRALASRAARSIQSGRRALASHRRAGRAADGRRRPG